MSEQDRFLAFVEARQGELVRFGWALTGDRSLGEDLAQAALQRLWPRWSTVSASGEPLAYTQRIMVSISSTLRRRRAWHVERIVSSVPETGALDAELARVDTRQMVNRWLSVLPPRQRAVIVLRFLLDLSVEQTADRLGCTGGTVKSQTSKALRTLKDIGTRAVADTEEIRHGR